MFWFGWTSGANIHWISPVLASAVWAAGGFLLFQAGLKFVTDFLLRGASTYSTSGSYLADCYPRYVASVMAGNDFFRSMVGASFPLFSIGTFPVNSGFAQQSHMSFSRQHFFTTLALGLHAAFWAVSPSSCCRSRSCSINMARGYAPGVSTRTKFVIICVSTCSLQWVLYRTPCITAFV